MVTRAGSCPRSVGAAPRIETWLMLTTLISVYKTGEGPRFVKGHSTTLSLVGFASLIYGQLWWFLAQENKKRREGQRDAQYEHLSEEQMAELGDESPRFMYTI